MINKFKNLYYGFLIGLFSISILSIYILKQNQLLMNIEQVQDYNSVKIDDKYSDNHKLKTILPKEIYHNDKNFEDDIKKTLNYVATVIDGKYVSNLNITGYQKFNNIITQNGGDLW
jgi:hypothetical protein